MSDAGESGSDADALAFDLEREVRLAVVLYGGVSLAIYMYGVAEELWRLVRATCPATPLTNPLEPPDRVQVFDDESTERVYRELARELGNGTIRTRFVVDIISGTSAGGLNGVFLAAALANKTPLDALKSVWIEEGGIDVLVNDPASIPAKLTAGLVDWFRQGFPPRSLLNGRRMLAALESALASVSGEAGDLSSPLVDELDLWVTSTDLNGLQLPIRLANATTRERRYANRYRFRFSRKDKLNDFNKQSAPFIAFAARSTSAFPFAFEPIRLDAVRAWGEPPPSWRRFYPDYRNDVEYPFAERSFADGGILDNKPFTYATETLARRHATVPVDRKLIYIEPDPAELNEPAGETAKDWNAIETAAAAFTIPRKEVIRQDIDAVVQRNRALERVRSIIAKSGADNASQTTEFAHMTPPDHVTFSKTTLAETLADPKLPWGPSYATYYRLKVANTIDYLAQLASAAAGIPQDSDEAWAIREVIAAWKETHYAEAPTGNLETDNAFMLAYGVPYRLRRLMFVYQKLKDLQQDDDSALRAATIQASGLIPPMLPTAANARTTYGSLRNGLANALDALEKTEAEAAKPDGPIATALKGSTLDAATLRDLLECPSGEQAERIAAVVKRNTKPLEDAAKSLRALIEQQAEVARKAVDKALGSHISQREQPTEGDLEGRLKYVLRFYYDAFEAYDLVLYPIEYAAPLGETNPVEIIRISPIDSKGLEDLPVKARELMGRRLHHFAGFLDSSWRRHDMVWGRLNGAESLIRALAPPETAESLIAKARDQIISDYANELNDKPESSPLQWFARQTPRPTPEPPLSGSLKRGAPVVATILTDILDKRGGATGSAWNTLRSILPDKPGGLRGVSTLLVKLASLSWKAAAALTLLVLTLLVGIGLICIQPDHTRRLIGVALTSASGCLLALLLAALAILVRSIRSAISSRISAFLDTSK
jgi:patatin-related protein